MQLAKKIQTALLPRELALRDCEVAAVMRPTEQVGGPDELLALVNRTLTENIARLGEDKYMTISALRRERDGSFRVAGMHQDLLVYRAATSRVEHLPAQGTWLGIFPDIKRLNPVRTVRLAPGDVLVLYTDGITEARRAGQMLDVEGLKRTLGEHGGDGAEALLGHIMASLEGYEVFDDVAAVVIRQLETGAGRRVDAA
jgi:sigma-B regulation protein RsbU (phosphoserine phosphatase)